MICRRIARCASPVLLCLAPLTGTAQTPAPDTLRTLTEVRALVERFGRTEGERVWPGYRPDTIPCAYVFRDRGTLLLGWRGALPAGYQPVSGIADGGWLPVGARGAAATSIDIGGRVAAQVPVEALDTLELFAVSAHEAFHAFALALRREGRRFGAQENTYYVASYPIFDPVNEAGVALEGRVLAAALAARGGARRALAAQFIALRESRHAALDGNFSTFEAQAELNEGLAEYALLRALAFAGARGALRDRLAGVARLTANTAQSFRLRFYRTGPAMALLLDSLAPGWQARLEAADRTLQGELAEAIGFHAREAALRARAAQRFGMAQITADARVAVAELAASRRRRADSALARPGVTVIVEGRFNLCGFDPQNLLRVDSATVLHTRWLRICGANGLDAEFNTPVLQGERTRSLRAVVGRAEDVVVEAGRLRSPGLAFRADSVTIIRSADTIHLRLP